MREQPRRSLIVATSALAFFVETLDSTAIGPAVPAIAQDLASSPILVAQGIGLYVAAAMLLTPSMATAVNRHGPRAMFCASLLIFGIGSVVCATAPTSSWFLAGRTIQGLSGGFLTPVCRLVVLWSHDPHDFVRAMGWVTGPALIAPAVGPLLGGFFAHPDLWRWLFLVNIPLIGVGLIVGASLFPSKEDVGPVSESIYLRNELTLFAIGLGLGAFVLGVNALSHPELVRPVALPLMFGAVALIGLGVMSNSRSSDAPLKLNLLRRPGFRQILMVSILFRLGAGGLPIVQPLFLELNVGLTPIASGIFLASGALGAFAVRWLAPSLVDHLSYRRTIIWNGMLCGILIALHGIFSKHTSAALLYFVVLLLSIARSVQTSCLNTAVYADTDKSDQAQVAALAAIAQQVGISGGFALSTFLLEFTGAIRIEAAPNFHGAVTVLLLLGGLCAASAVYAARLDPVFGDGFRRIRRKA